MRSRAFGATGLELAEVGVALDRASAGEFATLDACLEISRSSKLQAISAPLQAMPGGLWTRLEEVLPGDELLLAEAAWHTMREDGDGALDVPGLRSILRERLGDGPRPYSVCLTLGPVPRHVLEKAHLLEALTELRSEGLVDHLGLIVDDLEACLALSEELRIDAVCLEAGMLDQRLVAGIEELARNGMAVVARDPTLDHLLAGGSLAELPGGQAAADHLAEHGIEDPLVGGLSFLLSHTVSLALPTVHGEEGVARVAEAAGKVDRLPGPCLEALYTLGDEIEASGP